MTTNRLHEIERLGQAIWLDDLSRQLIDDGTLQVLVDEDGLSGVTSNPTTFEKAVGHSDRYDGAFANALAYGRQAREIFEALALQDVRDACDILAPVFKSTDDRDGLVSFELPPECAYDAESSIEHAHRLSEAIDRPNALIKVPSTAEGVAALEELTAAGRSINMTLLFALDRYREVAEAYQHGLDRRLVAGESLDGINSVASFFVSRVDTAIDEELDRLGRPELKGAAGIANARLAYHRFTALFSGPEWERLERAGAHPQRVLWASTSTKNPDYPPTMYVDALIGPQTVDTMPLETIETAREEATAQLGADRDPDSAERHLELLRDAGVDVEDVVCHRLVEEGIDKFAKSYDDLIGSIADKAERMRAGSVGRR